MSDTANLLQLFNTLVPSHLTELLQRFYSKYTLGPIGEASIATHGILDHPATIPIPHSQSPLTVAEAKLLSDLCRFVDNPETHPQPSLPPKDLKLYHAEFLQAVLRALNYPVTGNKGKLGEWLVHAIGE